MLKAVNNKEAKDFVDKVTTQISVEDSTYYDRLKEAIDSNNPVAIDETFSEGAVLLENAMESLGVNVENDPITGQWVAAAVVIVVVAAGMYVYAGHTAVQAVTVYNKVGYWGSSKSEVSDLEKEIFIDNVTERL
ncbi:hypothetical protein [Bacillus sp. FJAT-47783]|uniref:hypothetical protein n=1 Tax=Bacillus sp. FJAT-47783 TaxID=2922712 RepID=UPI001FAD70C5|nr:hypothetical protein [Bacillus sp. FJAT-47783]